MEKTVLKFLVNYNEADKGHIVNNIDEIEVYRVDELKKYQSEIQDIVWSYYDYTDKSLREVVEEFDLVKAKKFYFEIWYLLETGKQYNGVLRDSENDLFFID